MQHAASAAFWQAGRAPRAKKSRAASGEARGAVWRLQIKYANSDRTIKCGPPREGGAARPRVQPEARGPPEEGGAARRGMGVARGSLPFTPRHSGVGIGAVLGLDSARRHAGTVEAESFEGHPGEWADHSPGSQWDGKGDGLPVPDGSLDLPCVPFRTGMWQE